MPKKAVSKSSKIKKIKKAAKKGGGYVKKKK